MCVIYVETLIGASTNVFEIVGSVIFLHQEKHGHGDDQCTLSFKS